MFDNEQDIDWTLILNPTIVNPQLLVFDAQSVVVLPLELFVLFEGAIVDYYYLFIICMLLLLLLLLFVVNVAVVLSLLWMVLRLFLRKAPACRARQKNTQYGISAVLGSSFLPSSAKRRLSPKKAL
jgi:hypothetical protein